MTRLSVNINKVALIRNSRGENRPDLLQFARDCEAFGAQGITVHPRPDERHIRFSDLEPLKKLVTTEFNIEGYPSEKFIRKVCEVKPHQVTLVPDPPGALTSSEGWNTLKHKDFLVDVINEFKSHGIRVSLFLEADSQQVEYAKATGTDRIEFYTGFYAKKYKTNKKEAVANHVSASRKASRLGLGVNAGHDLDLENLHYYVSNVPNLLEVSIGHALISDALYLGIQNVIGMYLHQINRK
ncbi:MAG: pyridoxine 5'-phosphate synthase [Saprospiraceae bacterium]|nr:pyridoxine 5'-phosphate synthase [Bacteroidia bacterium]NNF22972.1 pyridoxine 5'-phosphate synthase [Saprospiraceae bacterium]